MQRNRQLYIRCRVSLNVMLHLFVVQINKWTDRHSLKICLDPFINVFVKRLFILFPKIFIFPIKCLTMTSVVWKVFSVEEKDKSKALCGECNKLLNRGGDNPRNYGTSNLRRHLKDAHPRRWQELKKDEENKKEENRKYRCGYHCRNARV